MKQLKMKSKELLALALAPSTRDSYATAFGKYEDFCNFHQLPTIPVCQDSLIAFSTDLSYTLAHTSIKVHLAAVGFHSAMKGYPVHFKDFKRLYYLLRGIIRAQGSTKRKKKRAPITPDMLKTI